MATTVLFLLLEAALSHTRGIHVLSMFLPVVPFVVVLLGVESRLFFAAPGIYAALAVFMVVSLGNGLEEAREGFIKYTDYNAHRADFMARHTRAGDVVIFSHAALMEHAGPLFFERVFLVESNKKELRNILEDLHRRNIRSCMFWTLDAGRAFALTDPYGDSGIAKYPLPVTAGCQRQCTGGHYLARIDVTRALQQLNGDKLPPMSGRALGG